MKQFFKTLAFSLLVKNLNNKKEIMKIKIILLFLLILIFQSGNSLAQANGSITGKIVDAKSGEELIGANILLEGTTLGAASDINGDYNIKVVAAGNYTLIASMIGYSKLRITEVAVAEGEVKKLDISLVPEAYETEEVVVTARMIEDNEVSLLRLMQKSNSVSDAISSELMAKTGSSNAADAMTKVIGASVVGGKYVYIRGLGERYSSTHLNGTELPSADPDKRSFNMDLFPTNVLENIVTLKSFTPDKPGNFSGGIIDIGTKSYPEHFLFTLSSSSSYNSTSSYNDNFLTYNGGGLDWLGMDDGSREIPDIVKNPDIKIPDATISRNDKNNAELLDQVSKSFNSQMNPVSKKSPLNQSYSISIGNQVEFLGSPLGFLGSLSYGRNYSFYEGGQIGRWKLTGKKENNDSLTNLVLLKDSKGTDEVHWGGLVTLNFRPHQKHELGGNLIVTQSGESTSRYLNGDWQEQFSNANAFFESRVLQYTERSLYSYQFHGKHYLEDLLNINLEWNASKSQSDQDEPDSRFFSNHYSIQQFQGSDTTIYSISPSIYSRPAHYFRDLIENSSAINLNLSLPFNQWEGLQSKIKIGFSFNDKDRLFTERRFEYKQAPSIRYNGNPESFFSSENVGIIEYDSTTNHYTFGNYISEAPDPQGGNYSGYEKVLGFYAMFEIPLLQDLKFIGGARYEKADMNLLGSSSSGNLDDEDFLPSVNLIYQLTENMNLRGSYGKTLARPNFREKAPYTSYMFVNDFNFSGNVDLQRTLIDNYDLRWEWFLRPGEIIAVSGFYKHFKNPIERVINLLYTSEGAQVRYENIDKAIVYGGEFEVRKGLDELSEMLSNFSFGLNLTLISSKVDIPVNELILIKDLDPNAETTRPLQGQSPFLANLEFGYDNPNSGSYASLFFNIFGDRLAEVSLGGTPNVFERSQPMLDLTLSQKILNNFNIRIIAKNLFNSSYKLTHEYKGAEYIRTEYKTGTSISVSASYAIN